MKNLKYFSLLMAVGLFAACSDNLNVDSENGINNGDKTPAYVTISLSNGVASSRANNGTGDGINHGGNGSDAEDSDLSNTGTTGEQRINTILLVALSDDNTSGFAKLYPTTSITTTPTQDDKTDWEGSNNIYKSPIIKLTAGTYKILVVANPYEDFVSSSLETTVATDVKTLYDKIRDGQFTATETTAKEAVNKLVGGNTRNNLMMSSKAEATVTLTAANTEENPAVAPVDIERTVSKITFRNTKEDGVSLDNVYKVPVYTGNVKAKTINGKIAEGEEEVTLNEAKDICSPTANTVYVYIENTEGTKITKVYRAPEKTENGIYQLLTPVTQDTYNAAEANTKKQYYVVADESNPTASLKYQFDETAATKTDWYIRIEGYALTNLSKGVYHVRHTITDGTDAEAFPFGVLNGSNYLFTSNWAAKNAVVLNADGSFAESVNTGSWFYNTLQQVSDESKKLTIGQDGNFTITGETVQYYQKLPTVDDEGDVTGGNDKDKPNPTVGTFMAYCFENSTDVDHQVHGLSTGISFVARMYKDAECTEDISELYKYNGYHFTTLQDIKDAFGSNLPKDVEAVINKGTGATKEDLESVGIIKYASNICYYYTTDIKHFDNGNNSVMGNMEFAIMRNNIYSLAISKVEHLGDPIVDPTPNIPNESDEAALQVEVKILPWIVRYNDIEF